MSTNQINNDFIFIGAIYCYYHKVIIAAELLKNADLLVKQKIHPTSIISGYRWACK